MGVPVITTTGTPWHEVADRKCGWWVEPTVDGIYMAIKEAIETDDACRREMGQRGRALVLANYTWQSVAKRMLVVYEQTLAA